MRVAIKDLDELADDYDERHAELRAELRRLLALPVEAPRVEGHYTNRTEGDVFRAMSDDERRAHLRQWTLTVWPEGSEDQNALVASLQRRRWALTYRHSLDPAEVDDRQRAMLAALKP